MPAAIDLVRPALLTEGEGTEAELVTVDTFGAGSAVADAFRATWVGAMVVMAEIWLGETDVVTETVASGEGCDWLMEGAGGGGAASAVSLETNGPSPSKSGGGTARSISTVPPTSTT